MVRTQNPQDSIDDLYEIYGIPRDGKRGGGVHKVISVHSQQPSIDETASKKVTPPGNNKSVSTARLEQVKRLNSRFQPTFNQQKIVSYETIYNEINKKLDDTFKQLAQGPNNKKFKKRLLQLALVTNDYFNNLNHKVFAGLSADDIRKAHENRSKGEKVESGIIFNKQSLRATFESNDFEEVKSTILRDVSNESKVRTLVNLARANNIFAKALLGRVVEILAWGDKKLKKSGLDPLMLENKSIFKLARQELNLNTLVYEQSIKPNNKRTKAQTLSQPPSYDPEPFEYRGWASL